MKPLIRSFVINGILLVLAILSWTYFVWRQSPAYQKKERAAEAAPFLMNHIPQDAEEFEFWVDRPGAEPVAAYTWINDQSGKVADLSRDIMMMNFRMAISLALQTTTTRSWKRI